MIDHIYDQNEFIKKTGIEKAMLDKLIDAQVLQPAGHVDGDTPYFDERGLETADAILKLMSIGYSIDDVIRIRRKVGLPSKAAGRHAAGTPLLTIGELAKRIDSNARTIKHWEEKGIIEPDSYTPGGFRLYPESYVKTCQYIQDLQLFGYTLDEIKAIADLVRAYLSFKQDIKKTETGAAGETLQRMKEQVDHLSNKIRLLEKGIERWRRLLKQSGKDVAVLSSRLRKEVQSPGDAPDATSGAKKTGADNDRKRKSRRKS
jgi:MerR family transcriptional regulator, copper efflux regulator